MGLLSYFIAEFSSYNSISISFSRFSVRLGEEEPSFESLWQKSTNNRMASTNQLDNTIYVGGLSMLRFVVAANMTMNDGDTSHYRLRVSLVPAKIGKKYVIEHAFIHSYVLYLLSSIKSSFHKKPIKVKSFMSIDENVSTSDS